VLAVLSIFVFLSILQLTNADEAPQQARQQNKQAATAAGTSEGRKPAVSAPTPAPAAPSTANDPKKVKVADRVDEQKKPSLEQTGRVAPNKNEPLASAVVNKNKPADKNVKKDQSVEPSSGSAPSSSSTKNAGDQNPSKSSSSAKNVTPKESIPTRYSYAQPKYPAANLLSRKSDKCYKVLILSPICAKSHNHYYHAIAAALADRCHHVTSLVSYPIGEKQVEEEGGPRANLVELTSPTYQEMSEELFSFPLQHMSRHHLWDAFEFISRTVRKKKTVCSNKSELRSENM
jgi:hypothetical protein